MESQFNFGGGAVSAVIHDVPNYDYVSYDIIVDVWDDAKQEWAGNSSIHFDDKAIVQGRNVKVVVPDIYRFSKWPNLTNIPLLALVGNLEEEDYNYLPAKVGDKIRLDVIISIWEGGRFYLRGDFAILTVSGRGSYLTEQKQCIIFEKQFNCKYCCN